MPHWLATYQGRQFMSLATATIKNQAGDYSVALASRLAVAGCLSAAGFSAAGTSAGLNTRASYTFKACSACPTAAISRVESDGVIP